MSKGMFKQSIELIQRKILHKRLSKDKTLHQWQERDRIKRLDNYWEEGKRSNKAEGDQIDSTIALTPASESGKYEEGEEAECVA